jgi:hypothetical protein
MARLGGRNVFRSNDGSKRVAAAIRLNNPHFLVPGKWGFFVTN